MKEKKENTALYMLKGIAAIMIICAHAPFPGLLGQMIIVYARTGVVLFFFISGYYMFSENKEFDYRSTAISKAIHLIKIAVLSYLFYYFWEILVLATGTGTAAAREWIYSLFSLKPWIEFFLLQRDMIAGPLWFLNALIVCYLVTCIFKEKMFTKCSALMAGVLLVINFGLMNILSLTVGIVLPFTICRNAWFYGIPVFILGGCLHRLLLNKDLNGFDSQKLLFGCLFSVILLAVEYCFIGYSQLYAGNIVLLFVLYIWAIRNKDKDFRNVLVFIGKELSLNIYIFHWAMIYVAIKVLKILHCSENDYLVTLLTITGTVIFSWMIYLLKRRIRRIYE